MNSPLRNNDANRLFYLGTDLITEYFHNTYHWQKIYFIWRECIDFTVMRLTDITKNAIETGDFRNPDKAKTVFSPDEEAAKFLEECKDIFPLKTVLRRNPTHVKDFFVKSVEVGREEFGREMEKAIDFVRYKMHT